MSETNNPPQHIAFIMDGNGRWAARQGKPRLEGHRQGSETVRKLCDALLALNVPCATFWAFSTENWKRPEEEVSGMFNLMRLYFKQELKKLIKQEVRVRFLGDRRPGKLAPDIIELMNEVEAKTAHNTRCTAQFAINYGGQDEILRATQSIAEDVAAGKLSPTEITPAVFAAKLDNADSPNPDLVIRTGGEMRLSGFMPWHMAYSEFYFSDVMWPDFTAEHLQAALASFNARQRRFGKTPEQAKAATA